MPVTIESTEYLLMDEACEVGGYSIDQMKHRVYRKHSIPIARYLSVRPLFLREDINKARLEDEAKRLNKGG